MKITDSINDSRIYYNIIHCTEDLQKRNFDKVKTNTIADLRH